MNLSRISVHTSCTHVLHSLTTVKKERKKKHGLHTLLYYCKMSTSILRSIVMFGPPVQTWVEIWKIHSTLQGFSLETPKMWWITFYFCPLPHMKSILWKCFKRTLKQLWWSWSELEHAELYLEASVTCYGDSIPSMLPTRKICPSLCLFGWVKLKHMCI